MRNDIAPVWFLLIGAVGGVVLILLTWFLWRYCGRVLRRVRVSRRRQDVDAPLIPPESPPSPPSSPPTPPTPSPDIRYESPNIEGSAYGYVKNVYNYQGTQDGETFVRPEDVEKLKADCRLAQQWEDTIARMEPKVDWQLLVPHLNGLNDAEREMAKGPTDRDQPSGPMAVLGWRFDLQDEVLKGLRAIGRETIWKQATDEAAKDANASDWRPPSWNVPRLRLALRRLRGTTSDILLPSTFAMLRAVGVVSSPEPVPRLSMAIEYPHAMELCLLRCLLLQRHHDVHASLLKEYFAVDMMQLSIFHHEVPPLPVYYVHRRELEIKIVQWLRTHSHCTKSALLLLHGMGSAGKTSLASYAALEALSSGFHQVVWLRGAREEKAKERISNLREKNENVLVIADDVENDMFLESVPSDIPIIATSRNNTIGKHTTITSRTSLEVASLSEGENDELLSGMLGTFKDQLEEQPGMWEKVKELCEEGFNMPLIINTVAAIIREEHPKWICGGVEYVENLKKRLQVSREELEKTIKTKDMRQHTGSRYPYENIYAALYVSIQRLEDEDRKKYQQLVIFGRGETILPITMYRLWNEVSVDKAENRLNGFSSLSIATKSSFNAELNQQEFILHDLMKDLLDILTTEPDLRRLRRDAVNSYCPQRDVTPVDEKDLFYYRHFVRLCSAVGEHELAARCLCSVQFLSARVNLGMTGGQLDDFNEMEREYPGDETLESYERLLRTSLDFCADSGHPDIVLRLGLARHQEANVFTDAASVVTTQPYRDRTFFQLDRRHESNVSYDPESELQVKYRDALTSISSIDRKDSKLLIGCCDTVDGRRRHKVLLVDCGRRCEVVAEMEWPGAVVLVRFLPDDARTCVVVTEVSVGIVDIQEGGRLGECLSCRGRFDLDGVCRGAGLVWRWLWLLVELDMNRSLNTVLRYQVSDEGFVLQEKFYCDSNEDGKIVVHIDGGMAAVGSATGGVVQVFRENSQRRIKVKGEVAGITRFPSLVLTDEECGKFVVRAVDLRPDKEGQTIYRSALSCSSPPVTVCFNHVMLVLDSRSGSVAIHHLPANVRQKVQLQRWPRDPVQMFHREDELFVCCRSDLRILVYPLRNLLYSSLLSDSVTGLPVNLIHKRTVLSLAWMRDFNDIGMLSVNRDGQLTLRGLLRRQVLLSVDNFYNSDLCAASVCRHSVAVSDGISITEFAVGAKREGPGRRRSVAGGRWFTALCHSVGQNDLYAVVMEEGGEGVLYRLEDGLEHRLFPVGRTQERMDLSEDGLLWVSDEWGAVVWWRQASSPLSVWSLAGERVVEMEAVYGCRVSDDDRCVAMWRAAAGTEWTVLVWDLSSRSCVFSWAGDAVKSAVFAPGGGSVVLLIGGGALHVVRLSDGAGTCFPQAWEAEVDALLSFCADGHSVLLLSEGRRQIIAVGLRDRRWAVVWDWRWTNESWIDESWMSEGYRPSYCCVADRDGAAVACVNEDGAVAVLRRPDAATASAPCEV